ncbi:MAG TPA: AI-2E family transporter YdiK [Roseiflexaceae bacterium]|nr:AI-2E family transporter YdiK [Roseiflexaceae bacterium]
MNDPVKTREAAMHDLTRVTLAVLAIAGLIAASIWVLRPFATAGIWSTMIVVSSWPLLLRAQKRFRGRRFPAVAVMVLVLILVIALPLALTVNAIEEHAADLNRWSQALATVTLPHPPDWVQRIPIVGHKLASTWEEIAVAGPGELSSRLQPYASRLAAWLLSQAGSVAMVLVHLLLTVIISAILYARGELAAAGVMAFARRLAGERGESAVLLAGQAIRAVALGIVVTAFVQSMLAWLGLIIAGVPQATVLTALIFVLCVAQLGPGFVLLPACVWLYWSGSTGWAVTLLIWTVLLGGVDNILRPFLIRRGANLPLLLIFAGVIGGLVAFGVVGLFIGPVVLAVTYTLTAAWIGDVREVK